MVKFWQIKIKKSIIIALFGFCLIIFGLAMPNISMFEKVTTFIFGLGLLLIGLLLQTPLLDEIKNLPNNNLQMDFDD